MAFLLFKAGDNAAGEPLSFVLNGVDLGVIVLVTPVVFVPSGDKAVFGDEIVSTVDFCCNDFCLFGETGVTDLSLDFPLDGNFGVDRQVSLEGVSDGSLGISSALKTLDFIHFAFPLFFLIFNDGDLKLSEFEHSGMTLDSSCILSVEVDFLFLVDLSLPLAVFEAGDGPVFSIREGLYSTFSA